ncbi:hypothetical protein Ssi03_76780 [Sphaerisporangium siamense]|uniref:IS3 family transposase n=1 Tax=Sphaerisporangium siamense TaxID=795645 RepID=A0A7W7D5E9_9ACTN|nr:hypothetical protein [Sphaerisporangium siamense]GII89688.1 hypothetical protein Ssi03_76780 [Sphaerisporangium siamense]
MNRFQFVEDHKALYGVKRLCRVLQVSRSGFYRWLKGAAARLARQQADEQLAARMRRIHAEHDGTYGSPRMTAELRTAGMGVNHKRVERVMREYGIAGLRLRKRVRTTIPEPDAVPVPDLLQRDFTAQRPNIRYVGDITYLPVGGGRFLYLATVVDLYSRRLVGWSIADHMRTELVVDALQAAAQTRGRLDGVGVSQRQRGAVLLAGVRAGLSPARCHPLAWCGRHQRRQRGGRVFQRESETRDAEGLARLARRPHRPPGRVRLDHPLQHDPAALPARPAQPDRLREDDR